MSPNEKAKDLLVGVVKFFIFKPLLDAYNSMKKYVILKGGRGSGKSFQAGGLVIGYAMTHPNSRILCVRGVQSKISESSLQILKDVIHMMGVEDQFIITENTLKCVNGADFLFYGVKGSLKSLQGISLVFADEGTEISEAAWDDLIPTIRTKGCRLFISYNPEYDTDYVYKNFTINKRDDADVIEMNYWDNPFFPDELRVEMEHDKKNNPSKYLWKWEGQLKQDEEGAVWSRDMIIHKYHEDLEFDEVVISVDPATTSTSKSDACGIVSIGKKDDIYYVLEDASAIISPLEWSKKSIAMYDKWEANRIVYESNQGGDMVKTIIHQIRETIKTISYHARKSKKARAEEIVALYEQSKVIHTQQFPQLEFEMVTFTGEKNKNGIKSPNSLDALVWGLKNLSQKQNVSRGAVRSRRGSINRQGTMTPRR